MTKSSLASAVLAVCCSTGVFAAEPTGEEVTIRFDARVGERSLHCGESYSGIGLTAATVTLQDFRIYVSNFRLLARDGSEQLLALAPDDVWQGPSVALLDFENATGNCNGNAATNTSVRGRVPNGDYVGLAFDIGVPVELNHQDTTIAAPPLNFSALTWPWRYGYKFTTIDLETGVTEPQASPNDAASGFSIHIGSVDCGEGSPLTPPEEPCSTSNRPSYRIEAFDPAKQEVVLDLAALLAETDVTVNSPETASGCMSGADDDDCVAIMDRLGLSFRSKASAGQRFVRVEAIDPRR